MRRWWAIPAALLVTASLLINSQASANSTVTLRLNVPKGVVRT